MYFTKIRLTPSGLTPIDFPIIGALPSDVFILKTAGGLEPTDVDLFIKNTLYQGGVYQNRRPQLRFPVLRIGLNPAWNVGQTASDLREILYRLLTPGPGDIVTMDLMNGATVVATGQGYVDKFEAVPWAKDPEVQLTMQLLNPYLEAPTDTAVATGALSKTTPTIANTGNAPTGFRMEFVLTGAISSFNLSRSGVPFNIVPAAGVLTTGDTLVIDTRNGKREVSRTRAGVPLNLLYALAANSVWHQLYAGNNVFATNTSAFNWGNVLFRPQYWGI